MKTAFITGITGQDGSYLAELLLDKGYKVIGLYRRTSQPNFSRINHIKDRLTLVEGDVTDYSSLSSLISEHKPNEVYNLAAQSHVKSSFEQPFYTTNVDYLGVLNLLEICRKIPFKLYQASTSEMYGSCFTWFDTDFYSQCERHGDKYGAEMSHFGVKCYQGENTPMKPNSPYAIAKLAAHNAIRLYRESYGIFACSGILFNHESERRGEEFVTRKITKYLPKLREWLHDKNWKGWTMNDKEGEEYILKNSPKLKLGNIKASRDWGHAKDYVEGMWLMLQQDKPDDYVLATGETHTVEEFVDEAFSLCNLYWKDFVEIDPQFNRPCEVPYLCGNAQKAKEKLDWSPRTSFKELVKLMVEADAQA